MLDLALFRDAPFLVAARFVTLIQAYGMILNSSITFSHYTQHHSVLTNSSVDQMAQRINAVAALTQRANGMYFRYGQFGIDIFQIPFERFALEPFAKFEAIVNAAMGKMVYCNRVNFGKL